jgi:hypothetical protein
VKDVGGGYHEFTTNIKVHKNAYAVATFGERVTPHVEFDSPTSTNAAALRRAVGGAAGWCAPNF